MAWKIILVRNIDRNVTKLQSYNGQVFLFILRWLTGAECIHYGAIADMRKVFVPEEIIGIFLLKKWINWLPFANYKQDVPQSNKADV